MLTQIHLPKLITYSHCPKKLQYSLKRELPVASLPEKAQLLKDIACQAYMRYARTGKDSPWRTLTGKIDKYVFRETPDKDDPNYDEIVEKKVKQSFDYIRKVKNEWYNQYYIGEGFQGYADLPCGYLVDKKLLVHDTIDLALFDDKELIVCGFSGVEVPRTFMYNDLRLRAQALFLEKSLNKPVTRIRFFIWDENTDKISVSQLKIHDHDEFMETTEKVVQQIGRGIYTGAYYPSISEQCLTCPYQNICSF